MATWAHSTFCGFYTGKIRTFFRHWVFKSVSFYLFIFLFCFLSPRPFLFAQCTHFRCLFNVHFAMSSWWFPIHEISLNFFTHSFKIELASDFCAMAHPLWLLLKMKKNTNLCSTPKLREPIGFVRNFAVKMHFWRKHLTFHANLTNFWCCKHFNSKRLILCVSTPITGCLTVSIQPPFTPRSHCMMYVFFSRFMLLSLHQRWFCG